VVDACPDHRRGDTELAERMNHVVAGTDTFEEVVSHETRENVGGR
jgi:hypothetical protein